ncbi:hypothetical protein C8Q74DRAFT_1202285 [Fomes fomentarius]|nr:hypothetical protein C8Q74DRAFT_1202285 [Fomes fomentarius]
MHLLWENVVKNLMMLWTRQYKGLNAGCEEYELHPNVWDAIGEASAHSGNMIPGVFGPRLPNVASDKMSWTADTRSFWIQYVGPVLLDNRFIHRRYYDHFVLLVCLIRRCLQFELKIVEITEIRQGFIKWVQDYEKIYYQYNPQRLSACPLTIHALLHIADSIEKAGPVWASWAFPMERYCGALQPAIRSRRSPYASLNRHLLDRARLTHIKLIYSGLEVKLRLKPKRNETGTAIPPYDTFVLLPPSRPITLDRGLQTKLISCLCTRFTVPPACIRRILPPVVQQWGKLRICNDGDTIRAAALTSGNHSEDNRDTTFVRYEALVDRNARYHQREIEFEPQTFYGQLLHILVVNLTGHPTASGSTHSAHETDNTLVLGVVQTCVIDESNDSLDIHYYSRMGATTAVDITTVQCAVGRIRERNRWAIIDRSGSLSRALFEDMP